jgi:hypothetical protein
VHGPPFFARALARQRPVQHPAAVAEQQASFLEAEARVELEDVGELAP